MRDSLLWAYRLHKPQISLEPGVRALVDIVRTGATATAIITDGRSITQRLKLRALGLSDLPAYVSDEYGGRDKPDPERFEAVMVDHPADRYLYVADNPAKDFVAPRALGWQTVGIVGSADRVHPRPEAAPHSHAPDRWIIDLRQLLDDLT